MIEQLHFLRPGFLWLFFPTLLIIWLAWRWLVHESGWQKIIDARLIVHLLDKPPGTAAKWPVFLLAAALALAILALAGPAWQKLPQPVEQSEDALIIVLDLSLSMLAADVKPSRITRAQHKIKDILRTRNEGLTALIVYAGDAHAVVPFTDDAGTIAAMVPALMPEIMPKLGSRPDLAVDLSRQLVHDAGLQRARLLLISDGIAKQDIALVSEALGSNLTLSILAVGTPEGGPIPLPEGGFLRDQANSIIVPKLTDGNFQQLKKISNGRYRQLQIGPQDINDLLASDLEQRSQSRQIDREFDVWRDRGASLVLFLLPIALLTFRRGWLLSISLVVLMQAPQPAAALEWADLWSNKNQRGSDALESGDAEKAAELFEDSSWKASANYKAGDYESAAKLFANRNKYNAANAHAKGGKLKEAIGAYNEALQENPDNEDALFNKKLVEELLKQQQQQQQQQQQEQNKDQEQEQEGDEQNKEQQENQDSTSDSQQQSDTQADENQNVDQQGEQAQNQDGEEEAQQDEQEAEGDSDQQEEEETSESQQAAAEAAQQEGSETEEQQALKQWLRKVPDDPGGLLRNKFRYQYEQNRQRQEYYDESGQIW